ncbi:hypothetical protein J2X72_003265 [Phyllobacterium sp. 1468]|nr:hypothetical protein [Phyllobacterium sp. 1468]
MVGACDWKNLKIGMQIEFVFTSQNHNPYSLFRSPSLSFK